MNSRKKQTYIFITIAVFVLGSAFILYPSSMNWKSSTTEIERHYNTLDVDLHTDYPKRQFEFCGELMPVNHPANYKKIQKEVIGLGSSLSSLTSW